MTAARSRAATLAVMGYESTDVFAHGGKSTLFVDVFV